MRKIMRECDDLFLVQGVSNLGHRRLATTGTQARLVVAQRLQKIILALAREARHRLGAGIAVGVA